MDYERAVREIEQILEQLESEGRTVFAWSEIRNKINELKGEACNGKEKP